jgi:hypothetical protein
MLPSVLRTRLSRSSVSHRLYVVIGVLDRCGYLDQRILQSLPLFDRVLPGGSCEDAEESSRGHCEQPEPHQSRTE